MEGASDIADGDSGISPDEISAITDVPIFLGYIFCYFLSGILVVQVFMYYLSFRRIDSRYLKLTVLAVFFVESLSTVFATMIVVMAIIEDGYLSYSIVLWGFKAVALLSGLVCSMVHVFYCWRIHILGGRWIIIIAIMILSVTQCVMVSLSGFGAFEDGDVLGAGTQTIKEPWTLLFNVLWLAGAAICDIIIAITIIHLVRLTLDTKETDVLTRSTATWYNNEALHNESFADASGKGHEHCNRQWDDYRNWISHRIAVLPIFVRFFTLPKLYANSLVATLNARLIVSGHSFRESYRRSGETHAIEDGFMNHLDPYRQETPPNAYGTDPKGQEAYKHRYSIQADKRYSTPTSALSNQQSTTYCFHLEVPTRRNSILDLRGIHSHDHIEESEHYKKEVLSIKLKPMPPSIATPSEGLYLRLGKGVDGQTLAKSKSSLSLSSNTYIVQASAIQEHPADTLDFNPVLDSPSPGSKFEAVDSRENLESRVLTVGSDTVPAPSYGPFPLKMEPLRTLEASLQPGV
ncbi:hypothetical protein GGU10DRAFT_371579 [Lentinula aff. detonsa]|uniref:Uncharacterized protein n=1 Tax=Lentinula aff. detonsa TaxID=2804958 RepID=A0AA38NS75_9AGAR|nr:hypothetical protein GGU10DRAFT_371579 [Lentinula aff. detonsa]